MTPDLSDGRYAARDLETSAWEILHIENRELQLSMPPCDGRAVSLDTLR